ncbi:MAG TPA: hypothetical protein PKY05_04020 [Fibrobacteria bacterium]|nr:hypothetical protein [Fibrobacteria bacterium]
MKLSPSHPTLLLRLVRGQAGEEARFELVFGLFRTVWTSPLELDIAGRRLCAKGAPSLFESFEQTLCWQVSEQGVSIQSDLQWTGLRTGLEDILLRAMLSFPVRCAESSAESPTRRLSMEGQAQA